MIDLLQFVTSVIILTLKEKMLVNWCCW